MPLLNSANFTFDSNNIAGLSEVGVRVKCDLVEVGEVWVGEECEWDGLTLALIPTPILYPSLLTTSSPNPVRTPTHTPTPTPTPTQTLV